MGPGQRATLRPGIDALSVVTCWDGAIDVDSGAIMFNGNNCVGYCNWEKEHKTAPGISLDFDARGTNHKPGPQREEITVNLQNLPAGVDKVICYMCSFTRQSFTIAKNLAIEIR